MSGNGDDIKVTYSSLEQTAGDIRGAAGVVQKQLDDIWAAVKKVTDGWDGEAHQMMLSAKAQFDARGTHIHKILLEIAQKIETGSADYKHTDQKASRLFDIAY
ncbi:WXG100 family type VII secretion target [Streptomyces palmae]|uniref:ESAT-6-like protein n=1 Tax=Streptomyces palmae TaxID=1701085 RepID=A0A4Z0HCN6_9ACTN|nr:WXG100 family type VII secretion target [Streptomyces palmae]TGB17586.1 WXG100 family type VII secretion target [Streptomyces palmae]